MENLDLASHLERRARDEGSRPFVTLGAETLGYDVFNQLANRLARGLREHGVVPGQLVCAYMPNCLEALAAWFGALKLGAVHVPLNIEFRGPALSHVIGLTEAEVMLVDESLLDALEPVAPELEHVRTLFVRGAAGRAAARFPKWQVLPFETLLAAEGADPRRELHESSLATLIFTSGTTGRSKACMISHRYLRRAAENIIEALGYVREDCFYTPFPLWHLPPAYAFMPAILLGARAALSSGFSTSRFWDEVRASEATIFDYMGATLAFLWNQPPRPDDPDNPARLAWGGPLPDFCEGFEKRFGVKLVEGYGSTDAGVMIYSRPDEPRVPGSCGRVIPGFDVRIFDEHDHEVPYGTLGEMVVRATEPSVMMDGYYRMPEETLAAFRNLWFHTGDFARRDAEGNFYFHTRIKEAIRRRGENISAFEIEEVLESHPEILEAAAHGVPSPHTEEEVKVCIVRAAGSALTPEELVRFCEPRMARYMIPRYVEFVESLPRTPTGKLQKFKLEEIGIGENSWDRLDGAL